MKTKGGNVDMIKPMSYESILGRSRYEEEEHSYQQVKVKELIEVTNDILGVKSKLMRKHNDILLKAPTGSGKTIITGGYIDMLFHNYDKVIVLWVSETPNLTKQSLDKLRDVFNLATSFYGEDVNVTLEDKNVIGINWEKIKNTRAREDTEITTSIDTLVADAREEGYKVIMVIDEAHTHADSKLSKEFIELIDADIMLNITATPMREYSVEIDVAIEDVQKAGFIKQGIILNDLSGEYNEEFRENNSVGDLTEYFLHQSSAKRTEIENKVKEYVMEYNTRSGNTRNPFVPLLVVQLPNNSNETMEKVENYFKKEGYTRNNGKLAVYTSNDYTDELDAIGKDEDVKVLLFKQAISKGWDCPRASVITLLREPGKQHFVTQTLGRILRMPYLEAYDSVYDELNFGYVYIEETENKTLQRVMEEIKQQNISPTLYRKEGIVTELDMVLKQVWVNEKNKTEPSVRISKLTNLVKDHIEYDKWFEYLKAENQTEEGVDNEVYTGKIDVTNLITDNEIGLDEQGFGKVKLSLSLSDLVSEFNRECKKNKINLDDIWEVLEEGIFPMTGFTTEEELLRSILANRDRFTSDVVKLYGELKIDFEDIYEKKLIEWKIPTQWAVPIDAELLEGKIAEKTPYNEMWLASNKLEKGFAELLSESDAVTLWYKNGDRGSKYFSIAYELDGNKVHFYPDFLIETSDTLYILETKGRLDSSENIEKVKTMQEYSVTYRTQRDREKQSKNVILGYVKSVNGVYHMYVGNNYKEDMNTLNGWEIVEF